MHLSLLTPMKLPLHADFHVFVPEVSLKKHFDLCAHAFYKAINTLCKNMQPKGIAWEASVGPPYLCGTQNEKGGHSQSMDGQYSLNVDPLPLVCFCMFWRYTPLPSMYTFKS